MAVSWIDTPGVPLDTPAEAIDFTVGGDVPALSVSFGPNRIEERAYRDGVFLYPYLASTREGTTYTLRRSGGWPSTPTVYIDEEDGPPAGGQAWGGIYTLDLAAQPSQNLNAGGAHVIDGLTWWAKNDQSTSDVQLVEGEGINWTGGSTGIPIARILCLPLANVPGFNPNAPVQVWFNVQRLGGSDGVLAGLIDSPADATPHTADRPSGAFWLTPSFGGGVPTAWFISRAPGNSGFASVDHGADWTAAMFGVHVVNAWTDAALIETGYAGGALPPLDPFQYGSLAWVTARAAKRVSPCLALTSLFNASTRIRKISVIQPRVAA